MKIEESHPLAEKFSYVALGHGHKPYVIETPEGKPYAYNPGSPERVNFGEEKYDKGYYFVTVEDGKFSPEFRPTNPRPMIVEVVNLDGAQDADNALARFCEQVQAKLADVSDKRPPLLELKLAGRVGFHPFELGRERLRLALDEFASLLHLEIKNHLSLVARTGGEEVVKKSLAEIEIDVLHELIGAHTKYKGREEELAHLSLAIRDLVLKNDVEDDELLGLVSEKG
jgi:DNA repair exonuclease SbcCD nuclease subunit